MNLSFFHFVLGTWKSNCFHVRPKRKKLAAGAREWVRGGGEWSAQRQRNCRTFAYCVCDQWVMCERASTDNNSILLILLTTCQWGREKKHIQAIFEYRKIYTKPIEKLRRLLGSMLNLKEEKKLHTFMNIEPDHVLIFAIYTDMHELKACKQKTHTHKKPNVKRKSNDGCRLSCGEILLWKTIRLP